MTDGQSWYNKNQIDNALNNYVPTAREYDVILKGNSSVSIPVAEIIRVTISRNSENKGCIYIFDRSDVNRLTTIGSGVSGIEISFNNNNLVFTNTNSSGFRCLIERFG